MLMYQILTLVDLQLSIECLLIAIYYQSLTSQRGTQAKLPQWHICSVVALA